MTCRGKDGDRYERVQARRGTDGGSGVFGDRYGVAGRGRALLVVAPRIVGRGQAVVELARAAELNGASWSSLVADDDDRSLHDVDVIVVDVLGELKSLYAIADVVFIGGTFAPVGGHNFLEACAHGKAVVVGPDVHNFSQDAAQFLAETALVQVTEELDLHRTITALLVSPERAAELGERARQTLTANLGASRRAAEDIEAVLTALAPGPIGEQHGHVDTR